MAKDRCTNPNSQRWKSHGGRGIKFLFSNFEAFYAELGPRPEGLSLERIDNDGNYEPGNVCWATRSQQQKNKRPYTHSVRHGKGYYFHKLSGKWMSRIKYLGKTKYLGLFTSEQDAEKAYTVALEKMNERIIWDSKKEKKEPKLVQWLPLDR